MEERVPVGAYSSASIAERVRKEQIVLERDSGPRLEARKEEKSKIKVAKVTSEFAGAVGKQDTLRQIAPRGVGTRACTLWKKTNGDISEEVREDEDELHELCLLEESENEQWQDVTSKK